MLLSMNFDKSCGASILKYYLVWGLSWKLQCFGGAGWLHVQFVWFPHVGASLSENTFSWSPRFGNEEYAKPRCFLKQLSWSFVFKRKKLKDRSHFQKHRILRVKLTPLCLILLLENLILHFLSVLLVNFS